MKQIILNLLLIFQVLTMCAQRQYFEKQIFTWGDKNLPYRIMLPANYNEKDSIEYPVILFLHGAGERGNDNEIQLTHIDTIFGSDSFRTKYPCFVVIPQCPVDKRWVEVDWKLPSHLIPEEMSEPMKMALALLIQTIHKYKIDTTRIYVTGLSMGGYGTWDIIARFPNMFAAAAPLCGGGDEYTACAIAKIPIWAFHGAMDKVVIVDRSRNMIAAIKRCGGNPKYTEFPKVGHNAWSYAYPMPELWQWMFEQKKK